MPSHNHVFIQDPSVGFNCNGNYRYSAGGGDNYGKYGSNPTIGNTGGSKPHEIMPPFHTLVYLMKL